MGIGYVTFEIDDSYVSNPRMEQLMQFGLDHSDIVTIKK